MKRVYLDTAAGANVLPSTTRAFVRALKVYGNPSAPYEEGRAARALLQEVRTTLAHMAGAKSEHVVYTGSATEANNLAIRGHVEALRAAGRSSGDIQLMYGVGAHASIVETMESLKKEGVLVDEIPLSSGDIDLEALASLIRPETTLVSLEVISSETGARYDVRGARRVLDEKGAKKVFLHVDASQVPLVESFERTRFGADLVTLDAQKVGGVRGIGALIRTSAVPLAPIIHGGGQERGLRSGTEAPALAAAFSAALTEAAVHRERFSEYARMVRAYLIESISNIPDVVVNEGKEHAPHILNISLIGRDTDYLVALLNEDGFAVSTRSSCETDSEHGSRAVFALTGDRARAAATLRISFDRTIRKRDVERFAKALVRRVAFLDAHKG